jgi:hypothetical protein
MSFKSVASERFWQHYAELPEEIQKLADKQYELFEQNPHHPSLQLKQVGEVWTARVGLYCRVIGYREGNLFRWGWIGPHEAYNKIIKRMK